MSIKIRDDGRVITKVDEKEYNDACPVKGKRRDRKALARLVCEHICETWGGTLDEVSELNRQMSEDITQLFNDFLQRMGSQ